MVRSQQGGRGGGYDLILQKSCVAEIAALKLMYVCM